MSGKLSDEELFECLKSLKVPVRLSDINLPNRDFIIRVLDCFLRDLSIDISSQNAHQFDAIKHMENPDAFQDLPKLFLLVSLMNRVTSADGLTITIKDIIEPKPKRTRRILHHLLLFWKSILNKQFTFKSVEETLLEEKKHADLLMSEIATLEIRKEECISFIDGAQPSREELESCVSSKIEKANELEKQLKIVKDEYESVIKKKENDLQTQNTSLDVNLVSIKEQISEIEQLILPSPDRLNTDLLRIKDSIKSEEIKIREKELDLKNKKKRQDTAISINEHNTKVLKCLQEIKTSIEEINSTTKNCLEGHQQLDSEGEQFKKCLAELEMKNSYKKIYLDKEKQIAINARKQKDSIEEMRDALIKKISDEQNVLKAMKQKKMSIEQSTNERFDFLKETIELCKEAESITQKKYAEYSKQMEDLQSSFMKDSQEIKVMFEKTFK